MATEDKRANVTVEEVLQEKAKESKESISNGGKEVEISLTDIVNVEFIKDFGFMKKGDKASISPLAYEVYDKNKVVKKIS